MWINTRAQGGRYSRAWLSGRNTSPARMRPGRCRAGRNDHRGFPPDKADQRIVAAMMMTSVATMMPIRMPMRTVR
jgi:hypothetical protein